jgi:hypothetical protein
METLLYVVLIALIGVVVWLLLARPQTPQIVYVQQEAPTPLVPEVPFYANWFPTGWGWGGWESPWWNDTNYRWSYERLYDGGWPWHWRRNNEKVYPSRDRERRRQRRDQPRQQQQRPTPIQPTINIQLPPAINTVTQRGAAPPPLPVAPPPPEPIPTIHTGPTAPAAAPPTTTEPLQIKMPDVIVPGSPDMEPLATVS